MDISELLKTSTTIGIELHVFCVIMVYILYWFLRGASRRSGSRVRPSLKLVYAGCALMIISDCVWACMSSLSKPSDVAAYIVNMIYFISSSFSAVCWFVFCTIQVGKGIQKKRPLRFTAMILYDLILLLYVLSPFYGLIFTIQDGAYVRGSLFYLDPIIKIGYIGFASILAIVSGRRKKLDYLRKKDYDLALFGVPVMIAGILQAVTGVDFNCFGITLSLILMFVTGITNPDSENSNVIYSLANSFEESFIVNMDTGVTRPLCQDNIHITAAKGMDYTKLYTSVLSSTLLPEDRAATLEAFKIENVSKRFKIDNSFGVRYRIKEESGRTSIHMASFIRAFGNEGRQEFLLGINTITSDSLIYERNEKLQRENQRLEQINTSIIESVAKIVEARDGGSGEHIVRVRRLAEIIAQDIMSDYPEYNLDEEKVKLIAAASVLHDVGKIAIPDAVLLKPGRLNAEEFEIMKTHSTKGCDMLNYFPLGLDDAFMECAMSICRWHHEKYDGKGYPDGLKGEKIPIAAQIVSAADCFDALVSDRPYKKAFSPQKAFEMMTNGECGAFSPKIIDALWKQKDKLTSLAESNK